MANVNDARVPMSFGDVVGALETERLYQLRRWGYRQPDGSMKEAEHSVSDWLVYMQHYLTKAFAEASEKPGNEAALEMLRKVTTMGIACFEQNGIAFRDLSQPIVNSRDGLPT